MKTTLDKLAQLFTFFLLLGLTTSILVMSDIEMRHHTSTANGDDKSLKALWDDTIIENKTVNFQIGTAILGMILFITIFSTIIYSKKEVNKNEH